MSYFIIDAIKALKADSKVSVNNEDINQIIWHDDNPSNITNKQITDKQTELKTIYDNNKYQRDRADAYPSIKDQLDEIYHNGIDGWKTTIKAVKDKYPKG
tara:strand:+ start:82 stop:381 length:300 start_codon:yes stop_codon:yes gene_type:complete